MSDIEKAIALLRARPSAARAFVRPGVAPILDRYRALGRRIGGG